MKLFLIFDSVNHYGEKAMARTIKIFLLSFLLFGFVSNSWSQERKYTEQTVGKHSDEVLGVFVNEDDTKAATCSLDETIKIWSIPDGKELLTLKGHLGQVNNLSFSGNDKFLASGSGDHTVRIWDVETGELLKTLRGHTDQVIGVYFSQDDSSTFVASTSFDQTVKLWNWRLGSEIKTLRGHKLPTNNVAYSYDGKYLASCSDDKTINIWSTDLGEDKPVATLIGHKEPVLTVLYNFDSSLLASSDQSGEVIIWNMPQGTRKRIIKAHNEITQDVTFACDNKTIATASLDGFVKLFDVETGENIFVYNVGVPIWSVDMTCDTDVIIVGCADGTVRYLKRNK
jgi:WD40 repeat protein